MADESKEKKTSSIVGDATKGVHDAWQFFFPPTLRLAICLGIFVYLGGGPVLKELLGLYPHSLASWNNHDLPTVLDQYKLTPLIPVVALFVLAALAYIWNQIIFVLASLLPVWVSYSTVNLLIRTYRAEEVWLLYPEIGSLDVLVGAIDHEIQKAHAEDRSTLVSGVEYWESDASKQYQQFSYCKFAMLWTIGSIVALHSRSAVHQGIGARGLFVLLVLLVSSAIFLFRYVYAVEQSFSAKLNATFVLAALNGRVEIPQQDPKRTTISEQIADLQGEGWWWITLVPSMGFIGVARGFDLRSFFIFLVGVRTHFRRRKR